MSCLLCTPLACHLPPQILGCSATQEEILPYIKFFQNTVRRKPFLIQNLENTMIKLIMSMDFFDTDTRKKIAIGRACLWWG